MGPWSEFAIDEGEVCDEGIVSEGKEGEVDNSYQNVPSSPGAYYINRLMTERVTNPGACFCHLEASTREVTYIFLSCSFNSCTE